MESKVTEIARDVYRISTFNPDFGIQFNQFLIKDDEPVHCRLPIANFRFDSYRCLPISNLNR